MGKHLLVVFLMGLSLLIGALYSLLFWSQSGGWGGSPAPNTDSALLAEQMEPDGRAWIEKLRAACIEKDRAAWNELRFAALLWENAKGPVSRPALHFALGQAELSFGEPARAQAEFLAGLRFQEHESELREGLRAARAELGLRAEPDLPAPFSLPGATELWVLLAFLTMTSALLLLLFSARRRPLAVLILVVGVAASFVVMRRHLGGEAPLAVVLQPELDVRAEPGEGDALFQLRSGELVRTSRSRTGPLRIRHRLGSGYVDRSQLLIVGER